MNLLQLVIQLVYFVLLDVCLLEINLVLPLLDAFISHQPLPVVFVPESVHNSLNSLNGRIVFLVLLVKLINEAVSELLSLHLGLLEVLFNELLYLFDFIEEILSKHCLLLVDVVVSRRVVLVVLKQRVLVDLVIVIIATTVALAAILISLGPRMVLGVPLAVARHRLIMLVRLLLFIH